MPEILHIDNFGHQAFEKEIEVCAGADLHKHTTNLVGGLHHLKLQLAPIMINFPTQQPPFLPAAPVPVEPMLLLLDNTYAFITEVHRHYRSLEAAIFYSQQELPRIAEEFEPHARHVERACREFGRLRGRCAALVATENFFRARVTFDRCFNLHAHLLHSTLAYKRRFRWVCDEFEGACELLAFADSFAAYVLQLESYAAATVSHAGAEALAVLEALRAVMAHYREECPPFVFLDDILALFTESEALLRMAAAAEAVLNAYYKCELLHVQLRLDGDIRKRQAALGPPVATD